MEKITVRIKNGKTEITTTGFTGPACQEATKNLSKALGKSVKDEPTAEMYQTPTFTDQSLEHQ